MSDTTTTGPDNDTTDERSAEGGSDGTTRDEDASARDDAGDGGGSRRRRRRGRRGRGRGRRSSGSGGARSSGDGATDADAPAAGGGAGDAGDDDGGDRDGASNGQSELEQAIAKGGTRAAARSQGGGRRSRRRGGGRVPGPVPDEVRRAMLEGPPKTMLVSHREDRTQVVVMEERTAVEHYMTRADDVTYVGNVYMARVQNVLPGMEAAFLDIGKGRNGVLYAGEVNYDELDVEEGSDPVRIEDALSQGQAVLVQVTKDPMGSKGPRLTMQVSLAGRYMVLSPNSDVFGISRKLSDRERDRLRRIVKTVKPREHGVIVRTAAAEADDAAIEADLQRLLRKWDGIVERAADAKALTPVYEEPPLVVKVIRDNFGADFDRVVVDDAALFEQVRSYLDEVAPELTGKVHLWKPAPDGEQDLFTAYEVREQLRKATERKVWLPSGGYLIIETTEAMKVIDVNTGKFTGRKGSNLEEVVFKTNVEAAREIVRQLRLRDMGGIIVIDFIDMLLKANQEEVLRTLERELLRDRTKTRVSDVSNLGLVDEAWDLYRELDDGTPMWEADLDQVERWWSSSRDHTSALRARCEAMVDRLDAAVPDADVDARVSLLTAAAAVRTLAATADVQVELTVPHPTQGLVSLLHWAVNGYALQTREHGERYHEKLRRFPAAVAEQVARLDEAAATGRAPLRRHSEATVAALDRMLAADVTDDPLLEQSPPAQLDEDGARWFRDGVVELVASHTRPALAGLRDALAERVAPVGRDDDHPGLVHRPDGEETYAELLAAYTRPGATAEEVHATGRAQLERLDREWAALGQQELGVGDPSEVRRRVAAIAGPSTAEEVRRRAEAIHRRAEQEAPSWFTRVPESPCVVRTTEHGSLAFYTNPAPDGSRPGTAFFNVSEPEVWGAQLAATVVHEGIPGHHYQLALAQEDPSLHELHRRAFLSAFGEGWALYVERIGDEMGLYPDGVARLGMLSSDALRATRLVVDTGLHAMGWTRRRAIDAMVEHTGLGRTECTAEVDRYIAYPGQATSYMTGRLAIERLRDDARERLGDDFDITAFHDLVLSHGIVSLDALDLLVEDWVTTAA